MKNHYDIVIVGSGPAGLAAAIDVSQTNVSAVLFDEQDEPGGQIYRSAEAPIFSNSEILGSEYTYGVSLIKKFKNSKIDYFPASTVWLLSKEREIGVSCEGRSNLITAEQVILATGAIERPFPIPGWTLPGVSTVGSAQILLKAFGLVEDNAVLVGSGPLLYLLAVQYLRAGAPIKAILDTCSSSNKWNALKYLPKALFNFDLLYKGQEWISEIKRAGIPHYKNISELELHGENYVSSIIFKTENGLADKILSSRIFLHQGISPNINLSMAAGCEHTWDTRQFCWRPVTKTNGETSIPGISIAGDGAGIIGAKAAEASGHVIANAVLNKLGKISETNFLESSSVWQKTLLRECSFRPFIDKLFQPRKNFRIPQNDHTIACRCEEVTVGTIRENVRLGCLGPNQMKAFCRAGMGPCQGRLCGLTISEIIANERQVRVSEVGYYRLRPPIKPLILGELANLGQSYQ